MLSIRLIIFWNSIFSEQLIFRIALVQNTYLLYLTDISEQVVFRKAIFQNSLFTIVSFNTFISLNNFVM